MAVKIKAGNRQKSAPAKPAARKSGAKATTRPTTRGKRAGSAAKSTPAKRGSGRPRKTESTNVERQTPTRRNRTSDIDPREEARMVKLVTKAGTRRKKAEVEHKESVDALHAAASEALAAGVSMAKVAEASGISRQWLYKMGEFAERKTNLRAGNGGSGNGKTAAKSVRKPAAKSTAKKSTARKTTVRSTGTRSTGARKSNAKTTGKTGTSKPRRRIRAAS
jgi:hypothetical protein